MELTDGELEFCHKLISYIRKDRTGRATINWVDDCLVLEPQIKLKYNLKNVDKDQSDCYNDLNN